MGFPGLQEQLAQQKALMREGENLSLTVSFSEHVPVARVVETWEPTEDYFLIGYVCSSIVGGGGSYSRSMIAVSYDPSVTLLATGLNEKATMLRVLQGGFTGIPVPFAFPAGNTLKVHKGRSLHFMVATDAQDPRGIVMFSGNFVLYLRPGESI